MLKYMSKDTKEMIKHCIQEPPTMDYQNAKKILGQEFGIYDRIKKSDQGLANHKNW